MNAESSTPDDFAWIPTNLAHTRVAVWGLGLMGGSLAMALHGKTQTLLGIDANDAVCRQAQSLGIFDEVGSDAASILPQADFVLLCAPLHLLPDLLLSLPSLHPGNAVIMDIGSTKTNLLQVMQELPQRFAPLGGHPMCGKEVQTLSNACSELYHGASFALLPLSRTPQPAIRLAMHLVEAVGANPVWLDARLHDRWVASISHLPYFVANCLSTVTPLEAAPLVGPGYKSTTRLAGESIEMMIDILQTNRENILPMLAAFTEQFNKVHDALDKADYEQLEKLFQEGATQRSAILEVFQKGGGACA